MGINREPKSMFYLLLNETFVYDVPALSNIIRPMVNLQKTKESIAFDLFLHLLRVSINYLFCELGYGRYHVSYVYRPAVHLESDVHPSWRSYW